MIPHTYHNSDLTLGLSSLVWQCLKGESRALERGHCDQWSGSLGARQAGARQS